MNLSPQDTARFYRIWWPLLHYVNARRGIIPDFPASPKEGSMNPQDANSILQALWKSDALREAFIYPGKPRSATV